MDGFEGHQETRLYADDADENSLMIYSRWENMDQFRAFMCDNALRMYSEANPKFFAGTVIEAYANERRA